LVNPNDAATWQPALAERSAARRQTLGADWAQAFYGDEEQAFVAFTEQLAARRADGATAAGTDVLTGTPSEQLQARRAQQFGTDAAERLRAERRLGRLGAPPANRAATTASLGAAPELSALQRSQQEAHLSQALSGTNWYAPRLLLTGRLTRRHAERRPALPNHRFAGLPGASVLLAHSPSPPRQPQNSHPTLRPRSVPHRAGTACSFDNIGPMITSHGIADALHAGGAGLCAQRVGHPLVRVRGEQLLFELRALKAAWPRVPPRRPQPRRPARYAAAVAGAGRFGPAVVRRTPAARRLMHSRHGSTRGVPEMLANMVSGRCRVVGRISRQTAGALSHSKAKAPPSSTAAPQASSMPAAQVWRWSTECATTDGWHARGDQRATSATPLFRPPAATSATI
jgi:hypothetical protein